ncbi:hypothetical protein C0995_011796 [Termitomyces sp. Mi166|nr:hypothetical protein C0995_011796 [Termitomyces sp. Mi166\
MVNYEDVKLSPLPAVPQIVFYQSGMGSDRNLYSRYVEGSVNYHPGDEVFLFGFSRGAYTGEIGILDRRDMDHFGGIFLTYQKLGKSESAEESESLRQQLLPWTQDMSRGKFRVRSQQSKFTIKCLGVFDTVGSFGLPEELVSRSNEVRTMFGFPDQVLGPHIEYAYQALALNETRADFNCAKFEQTLEGRQRGQTLKQIGGGYSDHDLSDLTLTWMAAQIESILSLDTRYLHIRRPVPTAPNDVTCETIHASVKEQYLSESPELRDVLAKYPELVMPLLPLEEEVRAIWPKLLRKSRADGQTDGSPVDGSNLLNGSNTTRDNWQLL